MSDDKMNMELGVSVKTEGTEKLTDLDKLLLRIKAAQDKFNQSLGKGGANTAKGATDALNIDKERYRVLRMQMGYQARELRDRQRDELRGIKEAERAQAQADRRALASARELNRERDRFVTRIGRGAGQVRGGVGRTAGVGAAAAAAGTYAAQRAVDSLTRSAVTIDDAMGQAMIHVYGSQDTKTSQRSAADLRRRLMPVAQRLGVRTADLIGATVEAAQAGVEDNLLDVVVEQGTKYAKMNKLNVPDVLEQSGYALQGLKTFGKVTADTVKSYYDEVAFLIATTSANRQQLLEATKTGMASGATVGMDRQQTLAVLGAITAVGGEGGQASRLLSTQGARAAGWRNKGRNILEKHHRSADDRQFLDAVQLLGYRDSDSMADAFSRDFFGSMVQVQDRIKGIADPLKRKAITKQLFGQEFSALVDSLIMGGQLQEFRNKLSGASGFLNSSWAKFTTNLGFIIDKIGVVLGNLTDTLSLGLKPLYKDLSQWIDRLPASFDGLNSAFQAGIYGFLKGLGSEDGSLGSLLNKVLGDPAQFRVDAGAFLRFGRGFGEGLRSVADSILRVIRLFTGQNADAEKIGRWTAEFLAMSAALVAASPAILAMSGIATAVGGFTTAMVGAWTLLRGAGLVGGATTAAGSAAVATGAPAAAAAATGGGFLAGLMRLVPAFAAPLTMDPSKEARDKLTQRLGDWAAKQGQPLGQGGTWQDVGPSKRLEEMRTALEKNTAATVKNTESTRDAAKQATESKAAEVKAEEARKLSELVSIRNGAMSGSVGGGPSTADQLRSRGFRNVIGDGSPNAGSNGGMPQADLGGTRSGGTRSWRNRNPGNLKDGPFARRMGAIGRDAGGFAVFPDEATGRKAQAALLFDNDRYKNLSIRDAIARYAPGSDGNDPASYAAQMARAAGVGVDTRLSDLTPAQREKFLDAQRDKEGWRAGTTTGGASPTPSVAAGGGHSVPYMRGAITMEGKQYAFGSGGHRGANSIPTGVYPITPNAIGPWGRANNAIGINNNQIYDKTLGRMRDGIELHAASGASMMSAGCLAILKSQYAEFRTHTLDFVKRHGRAWLKVDANGQASITADRPDDPTAKAQAEAQRTKDMGAGISKPATPKAGLGDLDVAPSKGGPQAPMLSVPQAAPAPRNITSGVPQGAGRRGGGAGGGVTVNIAAVHGGDPKANGEEVGKQVRSAVNSSYIDVDGYGYA